LSSILANFDDDDDDDENDDNDHNPITPVIIFLPKCTLTYIKFL